MSAAAAKRAQSLVFDIVRGIAGAGLEPGDRLPSQAEMVRRFGIGATPLREALRMLELVGLVSLRPGPGASPVVEAANAEHLAALVAAFLCLGGVTYGQLLEAWAATEPLLAEAAALNPNRLAVATELRRFAQEPESDEPVPPPHAIEFHDAVARCAGNPALSLVLQVISYVVADLYWSSTEALPPGRAVRHDHHEIAEAILAGDARRARQAMEDHARDTSAGILARIGKRPEERFLWARPRPGVAVYRRWAGAGSEEYAGASAVGSAK